MFPSYILNRMREYKKGIIHFLSLNRQLNISSTRIKKLYIKSLLKTEDSVLTERLA